MQGKMSVSLASCFTSLSEVIQQENYWERRVHDAFRMRMGSNRFGSRKAYNDNVRLMIKKLRDLRYVYQSWTTKG
jgi:NADH:ubiquinone oxidoreductase subunit H